MTAWATRRRFGIGTAVLVLLVAGSPTPGATPPSWYPNPGHWTAGPTAEAPRPATHPAPKQTPAQLRAQATAAERAGDWEAAFAAYCQLYIADRTAPDVREKLNHALRRVQQVRRHVEPAYDQFTASLPPTDAVNLFVEVVLKVPTMFADPARATPQSLWVNGVEELDRALGQAAFRQLALDNTPVERVEAFRTSLRTTWAKRTVNNTRQARTVLQALIADAQDKLFVRLPAALAVEMVYGACCGLDEYTVFLNPTSMTADPDDAVTDLAAYGLYLAFQDGGLVVEGVAAGSYITFHAPQLDKGDRIARINGRTMAGGGPGAVADALRMPVADGVHEIELFPVVPGMDPVIVQLPLNIPTVFGSTILKDGVGYLRIGSFQPSTPRELDDAVTDLRMRGMRSLIIDLRGNLGGSFLAGVEVARRLLPAGLIVTTQGQLPQVDNQVYSSESGMNAIDVPLVVLIDTETASAAEVVAAALKDNNRATLVGMPSFGKGTVQYPLPLSSIDDVDAMGRPRAKSGAVRVTIARLIAPRGGAINGIGVTPHVVIPDPARQEREAIQRAFDALPRSPMPPRMQY
jgi:C-terminal peptidase prc